MRFFQPANSQPATRNKAMLLLLLALAACSTAPVDDKPTVDTTNMAFIPEGEGLTKNRAAT